MFPRHLAAYLLRDAGYYPVLTLTGPRQAGKTVLARAAFPGHEYVSLEEGESRLFAKEDPRGFLDRYPGPAVIDEAQRVPELFSYVQTSVDRDGRPGRYVLTGSHNFLLMREISQTLAGRCGILHLLPFSRAELERQTQRSPDEGKDIFENRASGRELWTTLRAGFYPRIHDRGIPPEVWLSDYVRTYLDRDVRSLVNVGDLDRFERFLALCAGRVGQLLNLSNLANDCGISVDTARRWVSVLRTSFVIHLLPPHHRSFNKRIIKSPKLYFYDTGLACHLLGVRDERQLQTHPLRGGLFESYVIAEVAKAWMHHRLEPPLFFWRDRTGHEVDLLIERSGRLFPVEIKSGQTVSADMMTSLDWWCRQAGQGLETATLVYAGSEAYTRSRIAVRPWFAV